MEFDVALQTGIGVNMMIARISKVRVGLLIAGIIESPSMAPASGDKIRVANSDKKLRYLLVVGIKELWYSEYNQSGMMIIFSDGGFTISAVINSPVWTELVWNKLSDTECPKV